MLAHAIHKTDATCAAEWDQPHAKGRDLCCICRLCVFLILSLALHLKIAAWHEDMRRLGQCPRLALGELKTILVPRQALLKRLDPTGELSVPTLRMRLQPLVRQHKRLVILDRVDADLREALEIYNYFH
jgi:hypothetical protein